MLVKRSFESLPAVHNRNYFIRSIHLWNYCSLQVLDDLDWDRRDGSVFGFLISDPISDFRLPHHYSFVSFVLPVLLLLPLFLQRKIKISQTSAIGACQPDDHSKHRRIALLDLLPGHYPGWASGGPALLSQACVPLKLHQRVDKSESYLPHLPSWSQRVIA